MFTKMPSELSKRLLQAQSLWDEELQNLRVCVKQLEVRSTAENSCDQQSWTIPRSRFGVVQSKELLAVVSSKLESIDELRADVGDLRDEIQLLHDGQDTTVCANPYQLLTHCVHAVLTIATPLRFCTARIPQLKALSASVTRVEADLLGLYDWSREKMAQLQQEVTYSSAMLAYFSAHAKILPK